MSSSQKYKRSFEETILLMIAGRETNFKKRINTSWGVNKIPLDFLRLPQGQNTGFRSSHKTSYQCSAVLLPPSPIIFQDVKPLKGGKDFRKVRLIRFWKRYLKAEKYVQCIFEASLH
ncbi:hypothetical protein TNCV_382391 [Trichonephila clavipes]|nr:hypothetical protein TNCV_382391 [Trichonephila clavipes]